MKFGHHVYVFSIQGLHSGFHPVFLVGMVVSTDLSFVLCVGAAGPGWVADALDVTRGFLRRKQGPGPRERTLGRKMLAVVGGDVVGG